MPDPVRELSQPQPRPPFPELLSDSKHNEHLGYIQAVLDSNAHISAIVNHQKQIVLSNERLVKIAGLDSLDRIIGNRPGEALSCIQIATGVSVPPPRVADSAASTRPFTIRRS